MSKRNIKGKWSRITPLKNKNGTGNKRRKNAYFDLPQRWQRGVGF